LKKHAKGQQILSSMRPTYESYCIGEYDLPNPYGDHRKIQPGDDTKRCSQRICPLRSRRSRLYEATARIRRKEKQSTVLKKSPVRTTTITTVMAEESHELADRIGFQRGTPGAVCHAERWNSRLLLRRRYCLLLPKDR